ncbi:hypothetical protein NA57DRAFT_46090 [Rhizodiscina lignyota]|uniref:VWFA domain-containing protein n=1 Tax=Rhizodiscina lignyota TaxID=1504668 RepID=A0A9P4I8A0_9PEZI|nr:hypothetical protein NA57DRAFT_46090 [Rhizodiscina lignyota]
MHLFPLLSIFLTSLPSTLAASAPSSCPAIDRGTGGRKIALVVDSSGSNADTDPNNLRIAAARALNNVLISKSEATPSKPADQVTVVEFDYSASVLFPLGDPASPSVDQAFDQIDADGGTDIASGVEAGIDEITKGSAGSTSGRSGVVVLTDGQSSFPDITVQLQRARKLGVRVSFGFLNEDGALSGYYSDADFVAMLKAVLATGGVYSEIGSADAQRAFVAKVLASGLTGAPSSGGAGNGVLSAGIATAATLGKGGKSRFTYDARKGERLNFTVQAIGEQELSAELSGGGKVIKTAKTDGNGLAQIVYTAARNGMLGLLVQSLNGTGGSWEHWEEFHWQSGNW